MHPSEIRAQLGMNKIPFFKLTDIDRSRFLATRLQAGSGGFVHLTDSDVDRIEIALRTLFSVDHIYPRTDDAKASLAAEIERKTKYISEARKHLHGLISLFEKMEDTQVSRIAICLQMMNRDNDDEKDRFESGYDKSRIREMFRTIKAMTRNPSWFDRVIVSLKAELNHKGQDRWLNITLDDFCDILRDRGVVLRRNPNSAPFGLVLDAIALVRPDITAAQIDSYLHITRQGVGRSSFGRRWSETDDDPPIF